MTEFFYQLKAHNPGGGYGSEWITIWNDVVLAEDKKSAKKSIQDDYGKISEKISRKSKKKPDYRLFIVELKPEWRKFWLGENECKNCHSKYKVLEARQHGIPGANPEYCSSQCQSDHRKPKDLDYFEGSYGQSACIYRIRDRRNDKCYIGQTIRPFTLRWWEHMYHPSDTKFHKEVQASKITDWIFEVVEVLPKSSTKKEISNREQFWIHEHDSINNGYNTAAAAKVTE